MATYVSDQAFVHPQAELDDEVYIGPFCCVGQKARIGQGTRLENNVSVMDRATLGAHNRVYPGAVIGGAPQDVSYAGSDTQVVIGDYNVIREGVTVNRATEKEDGVTRVGNHNFLMACCHVAHDCQLADHIVIANNVLLGGHVRIAEYASISGGTGVHHWATIGRYSFVSGLSRVLHDVPPYMLADGSPSRPRCVNVVALKRGDFDSATIAALAEAHRLVFRAKVGVDNARDILGGNESLNPAVEEMLNFIENMQQGRHGRARDGRRAA